MTSEDQQPPQYDKNRSLKIGIIIILLAVLVYFMNRFIPAAFIVQAQLITVGIMGFLLIYDWREMYFDWKRKNRK